MIKTKYTLWVALGAPYPKKQKNRTNTSTLSISKVTLPQ